MKKILGFLMLLLLGGTAVAAVTSIAQLPLLNITGTGNVKPNLMLLYDNSGSMSYAFTPDYVDDSSTCRSRATMGGGTRGCSVGQPPFNSSDFNRQYYDPKVTYTPPVKADGTSFASMTSAYTSKWTSVTTDGFGVNTKDLLGANAASTNLAGAFPDLKWCDTNKANCVYNTATYTYPNDSRYTPVVFYGNPYYYTINVAEYCTDDTLTKCTVTAVGAAAPAGYPKAAKVRWCDSTGLTTCQAKYSSTFKYPRFSNPNGGVVAAYGTVTINASSTANSMSIASVTVGEPGGPVVITNGIVTAANGTSTATNQAIAATSLAASIIAKNGLTNQYLACVKAPNPSNSTVPACSSYGISLGANNIVAVVPIDCLPGTTSKAVGICSVLADGTRSGWSLSVNATPQPVKITDPATALISVAGPASSAVSLNGALSLGGTQVLGNNASISIKKNDSAATVAAAIASKIGTAGTIKAYVGPNNASTACANAATNVVCLVDTSAASGGATVSMGSLSASNSGISFTTTAASTPTVLYDVIPTDTAPLGAGAAVFVRTDIVSGNSYPKAGSRSDCAGSSSCTYDEEMTNFANWYAYYKTRNQMMKTAVGQAFQPLNANYNVGIVSLETAAAEGPMTPPGGFSSTVRSTWYNTLYAMSGSQSTPLRPALNAVGKMYANQSPYVAASGSEVVQYPCQQNFTFLTTDGYWNGGAAQVAGLVRDPRTGKMVPGLVDLPSNDEKEDAKRFCTRGSGCVDPTAQSSNTLADVALYWYNGGSDTTVSSLRTSLEDWTKPGLVPSADGENTRLHMNTYTLGLGVDGIMNYEDKYETPKPGGDFYNLITGVATGCPWNNNGRYVWPDVDLSNTSGSAAVQARVDDLWHAAINGHGRYFSASDPKQVVAGLSSALANIKVRVGAAAAAATSTPNISQQDNDIFSDTFTTVKWYGELTDRKLDPVTGNVGTTTVWNSSNMVGRKVANATDTRVLWMIDPTNVSTKLKEFRYEPAGAYLGMTPVEKAWFDNKCTALTQCATLSTSDRAIVDAGKNIVDWLRGQQQYADGTIMRAYGRTKDNAPGLNTTLPIVLGDIASSKPAYLREPRKGYTGTDYATFKTDQTKKRAATVFVAANDGMLHAFTAATGEEIWAYAPRITMKKLYLQASTTYGTNHQFTTDGSPEVADVKLSSGWGTVLVAGLNAGGRGYYALDVTNPASPKALWELCADPTVCSGINYDADIGLSFGNPQFGTWKDAAGVEHWVVFLTAGYNNVPGSDNVNSGSGKGYLYVVDVETGRVLDKTSTGAGDTTTPSGFARITAVSLNPATDPKITYVYGGDNLGKMWRFDFSAPGSPTVVQMGDAGVKQPVTSRPEVTMCRVNGTNAAGAATSGASSVVIYGTGRLLDLGDIANTDIQSVYVLKDGGSAITPTQWRNAANMSKQKLAKTESGNGYIYTMTGPSIDLSTQAGWYFDLDQNTGERVNLDPKVVAGTLNVVSNMPTSSTDCSVGGSSNLYQLDVCTGEQVVIDSALGEMAGRTLSTNAAAVGFIIVRLPNGTLKLVATTADGGTVSERLPPAATDEARRAGWRRVRE